MLLGRLRAMWLSNVRIRALAQFCLKLDPPIYGFDQKGIFMNEAGSKDVRTLAHTTKMEEVALKENHAASRARVSLMTTVVSTQSDLDALEHGPPIEIMFKAGTDRVLKGLQLPESLYVCRAQWELQRLSIAACLAITIHTIIRSPQKKQRAEPRSSPSDA